MTQSCYSMKPLTRSDGTSLALHTWRPLPNTPVTGVLYYVHGIQSHAGWLLETGPALAKDGVVTVALDRHGSGRSEGMPGDIPSARVALDDYRHGLIEARRQTEEVPLTVLGQSFGASIVAAMAVEGLPEADQIIYCTPALGQQRARLDPEVLRDSRNFTGTDYWPLGLADEDYTDKGRYLEMMANDGRMLRQITMRTRAAMVALEDIYIGKPASCKYPVHYVRPLFDPIIDLASAEKVLKNLHGAFETTTYSERRHYLEFSGSRRDYWKWLSKAVASAPAIELPLVAR